MSTDSSPSRSSVFGEEVQTQALRVGGPPSRERRSLLLSFGDGESTRSGYSPESESPFSPVTLQSLSHSDVHLRFVDSAEESEEWTSDDGGSDLVVSYSRTVSRASRNESPADAPARARSG